MADKLVAVRIKQQDGTYSNEIPIGTLAENVAYSSTKTLLEVLGTVDLSKGDIQTQLDALFLDVASIGENIAEAVDQWIEDNQPEWQTDVPLDSTLTSSDRPPVSNAVPKLIAVNESPIQGTKLTFDTTNSEALNILTDEDIDDTLNISGALADAKATGTACDTLAGDFAATYVPDQAYAVGDYCTYQYQLYQCKTAIAVNTDHTFVTSHWNLITVTDTINDQVDDLKTQINNITDATNNIFDPGVLLAATGITLDNNGYYTGTANAFHTAFSSGVPGLVFEANSKYYLSLIAYTDANSYEDDTNGIVIRFFNADNTQLARTNLKNNVTTATKFEKVTNAGSISVMKISKSSSPENIWHLKDIMLVKSDTPVDYYPHETAQDLTARNGVADNTQYINRTNKFIQTDLENKQIIFLNKDELEIGAIKQSDGTNDNTSTQKARTKNYIPLAHSENNFSWAIPGYYVGILEYSLLEDGTYSYNGYVALELNSGKFVPKFKTTHIRLQLQDTLANYITDEMIEYIAYNFKMYEERDINTYLKVCTFNMARPTALKDADAAGLQQQIWNYLEFLGKYNPHVLMAQEAQDSGANYWYWDTARTLDMRTTVFDRKYKFKLLPDPGKKIFSQYNFTDTEVIDYTSQGAGDNNPRTYVRSFLHYQGKKICIINTHCTFRGYADFEAARKGQFEELATEMAQHEYCIAVGDFNAYTADEFDVFSNFNIANCGDFGVIDTWFVGQTDPLWPDNHALDNIITTKNIDIEWVEKGKYDITYFSDHTPLVATLRIN